jgi:hypothetical protein
VDDGFNLNFNHMSARAGSAKPPLREHARLVTLHLFGELCATLYSLIYSTVQFSRHTGHKPLPFSSEASMHVRLQKRFFRLLAVPNATPLQ